MPRSSELTVRPKIPAKRRWRRPGWVAKAFLLISCGSLSPAFAEYGDVLAIHSSSALPSGWAIVGARFPTSGSTSNGKNKPEVVYTIKDLRGAPYGSREAILGSSPVPSGWFTAEMNPDRSVGPNRLSGGTEIVCLIKARQMGSEGQPPPNLAPGEIQRYMQVAEDSPVPEGWTVAPCLPEENEEEFELVQSEEFR